MNKWIFLTGYPVNNDDESKEALDVDDDDTEFD